MTGIIRPTLSRFLYVGLLAFVLPSSARPAPAATAPDQTLMVSNLNQNLLAYLPFNGDATDISGNGHSGVVTNATLVSDRFGNAQSAYSFNGTSSRIELSNTSSLHLISGFTLVSWVRFTALNLDKPIFMKHQRGTSNGFGLAIGNLTTQPGCPSLYIDASSTRRIDPLMRNDDAWHLVVGTFDGTTGSLYVDGALKSSAPMAYTHTNTAPYTIGFAPAGTTVAAYFAGAIDDVRLYDRALSADEVSSLYDLEQQTASVLVYVVASSNSGIGTRGVDYDYDLGAALAADGFSVVTFDRTTLASITPSLLQNFNQLWLVSTNYSSLATDEINAITAFHDAGHGVMVIGDSIEYDGPANALTYPRWNVQFTGSVSRCSGCAISTGGFPSHPIWSQVASVQGNANEGHLLVSSPAQAVATQGGTNMVAVRDNGVGRVVCDATYYRFVDAASHATLNIGRYDNARYARNVALWLGERSGSLVARIYPTADTHTTSDPVFTWYALAGATAYTVKVASDLQLANLVWTGTTSAQQLSIAYDGPPLSAGTPYYWSVAANVNGSWTGFGTAWRFYRDAGGAGPLPPTLIAPVADATIGLPETFAWTISSGATRYRMRIAAQPSDASLATPLWSGYAYGPNLEVPTGIPELSTPGTYYWAVNAIDAAGNVGGRSAIRGFVLGSGQTLPGEVALLAPAQDEWVTTRTIGFSWQGDNATSYDLTYSVSPSFPPGSNQTWTMSGLTQTAASVTLNGGTQDIWWKVTPRNAAGSGPTSEVRSFRYLYRRGPITSIVIARPMGTTKVARSSRFTARALVTGDTTCTLTGSWRVDGAVFQEFSVPMTATGGAVFDSPPLPTTVVGAHTVKLVVNTPQTGNSTLATYQVVDAIPGPAARLSVSASPSTLVADGTSQATVVVNVLDANDLLVTNESGRAISGTLAPGASGILDPPSGVAANGTWATTYHAGTIVQTEALTVASSTPTSLPSAACSVSLSVDQLAVLRSAANEYLNRLANLHTDILGLPLPLWPSAYNVAGARAFVTTSTEADTAGLARLALAARVLLNTFYYQEDDDDNYYAVDPARDGGDVPGAHDLGDTGLSSLQRIISAVLVLYDSVGDCARIADSLGIPFIGDVGDAARDQMLNALQYCTDFMIDNLPYLDDDGRNLLQESVDLIMIAVRSHYDDLGLGDVITSPVIRRGALSLLLGTDYIQWNTQHDLDQATANAVALRNSAPNNSHAEAILAYRGTFSSVQDISGSAYAQSLHDLTLGDAANQIADLAQVAAILAGPASGGTISVIGQAVSLACRIAAGVEYANAFSSATGAYWQMQGLCQQGVQDVFGEAGLERDSSQKARGQIQGCPSGQMPNRDLWARLLAAQTEVTGDCESLVRELTAAVARDDTVRATVLLPQLIGMMRQTQVAAHLAATPVSAASGAARFSIAQYDSVVQALNGATVQASISRTLLTLSTAQFLLQPDDPLAKQQVLDAADDVLRANQEEQVALDGAVLPLFTTPAVPTLRVLGVTAPDSTVSNTPFVVTMDVVNLGAGTTDSTLAYIRPQSGLCIDSLNPLPLAALAPGDTAHVEWTLRLVRAQVPADSLTGQHSVLLQLESECSNGLGEGALSFVRVTDAPSDVRDDDQRSAAQMMRAFPNPTTLQVTFSFGIPEPQRVNLDIYDIRGRLVATLVDQDMASGQHDVTWSGRDLGGRAVASGVYYARLRWASVTHTQRINMVR